MDFACRNPLSASSTQFESFGDMWPQHPRIRQSREADKPYPVGNPRCQSCLARAAGACQLNQASGGVRHSTVLITLLVKYWEGRNAPWAPTRFTRPNWLPCS